MYIFQQLSHLTAVYLIAGNFKHFHFYLAATENDTKGDKVKISIFLTCFGQKEEK